MTKLLLRLLALLVALNWVSSEAAPRFEVVPAKLVHTGQGRLSKLEQDASKESLMGWVFGTDCYTNALRTIQKECRHLDHEGRTRLALAFANCHLAKLGKRTYACTPRMSLAQCVNHDDPDFFFTHMQFFSEVDSMCLYVQNQDFQRHTEFVLNLLYHGGSAAAQRLQSINASLAAHSAALGNVASHLEHVSARQEKVSQSVEKGLTSLDVLRDRASSLDAKMQLSLDHQDLIADRQLAVMASLGQLEQQERRVLAAATDLHKLAKESATEFVEQQRMQGALQHEMLADLREVASSSKGVAAAMHAVAHYQRRSEAVLVHLLGRSYGAADVMFYVAGSAAATAAGAASWTRAAKLPLMALFGSALVVERCLPPRLHRLLHAGNDGQVLLRVPLPQWAPALRSTAPEALMLNFKWLVRRLCLAAVAAVLLYTSLTFHNVEKENVRTLQRIEAYQKRQDAAQEALKREVKAALRKGRARLLAGVQAMLDERPGHAACPVVFVSGSGDGTDPMLQRSDAEGSEVTSLPQAAPAVHRPQLETRQPVQNAIIVRSPHRRLTDSPASPAVEGAAVQTPSRRTKPARQRHRPEAGAAAVSTRSAEQGTAATGMAPATGKVPGMAPAAATGKRRTREAASDVSGGPAKAVRRDAAATSAVKRPLEEGAAIGKSPSGRQTAKRQHQAAL